MEKTDITAVPLPIGAIHGVYQGFNRGERSPQHSDGRFCDALTYTLSGACAYVFDDGTSFTVEEGQILYLARDAVYDIEVLRPCTFIYCNFDFLWELPRKSAPFVPERPQDAEKLFRRLLQNHQERTPAAQCRSAALLYEIYAMLWTEDTRTYAGASAERRIRPAEELIRRRYRDPALSISDLAGVCGVSEVYFRKLFLACRGVAPSRYLLSVRLEKAREMLCSPYLSVEACATQSGFASTAYFCRVFRREVGVTPTGYRREHGFY